MVIRTSFSCIYDYSYTAFHHTNYRKIYLNFVLKKTHTHSVETVRPVRIPAPASSVGRAPD